MPRFPTLSLFEARQDYAAMFSFMDREDYTQDQKDAVAEQIKWAREVLVKSDRIVWYLRLYREVLTDTGQRRNIISGTSADRRWRSALSHFMSLDYVKIQNFVFGNKSREQVMSGLKELEKEFVERSKGKIASDHPSLEGSEIIIDCGDGWFWVSLNRAACEEEGKAMGHCGNTPRSTYDDNILSLRKKTKNGWEPHLTFTINEGGELMEMKGRGNAKPAARYHEMIVKLLLHSGDWNGYYVSDMTQGSWLPENDFSVQDLSEELRQRLLRERPSLGNIVQYVQYGGDPTTSMFLRLLRRYSYQTNFPIKQTHNWYDWIVENGHLYYHARFGQSALRTAVLGEWNRSGGVMDPLLSLRDDPTDSWNPFGDPEEDERIKEKFARHDAEVKEYQKINREWARDTMLDLFNEVADPARSIIEVEWENNQRSGLPVRITDPKAFVLALENRFSDPMRSFIKAMKIIQGSSLLPTNQIEEKLEAGINRIIHR